MIYSQEFRGAAYDSRHAVRPPPCRQVIAMQISAQKKDQYIAASLAALAFAVTDISLDVLGSANLPVPDGVGPDRICHLFANCLHGLGVSLARHRCSNCACQGAKFRRLCVAVIGTVFGRIRPGFPLGCSILSDIPANGLIHCAIRRCNASGILAPIPSWNNLPLQVYSA